MKFTPDLPRPEDNSVTAVRHVDTMSPQEAAAPGRAAQRLAEPIAGYLTELGKTLKSQMYNEGLLHIKTTMEQAASDATQRPGDYLSASASYSKARDAASQWIQNRPYDKDIQKQLQQELTGLYSSGSLDIQRWVTRQAASQALAKSQAVVQSWTNSGAKGGVGSLAYAQSTRGIIASTMGLQSALGDDATKLILQKRLSALDETTAKYGIDTGQAQVVLDNLRANKYKYLTTQAAGELNRAAQDALKAQKAQHAAGLSYMEQETFTAASMNGNPDPQQVATIITQGTPAQVAEYKAKLAAYRQAYDQKQELLASTPEEQNRLVEAAQAKIAADPTHAVEHSIVYNEVARQAAQLQNLYATDPAQYGMNLPQTQALLKRAGQTVDVTTGAGFHLQAQALDAMYNKFGVAQADRMYLTNDQLATLRQNYVQAPPAQALQELSTLEKTVPAAYYPNLMRQLYSKEGLPTSALFYDPAMNPNSPATQASFAVLKAVDTMSVQSLKANVEQTSPGNAPVVSAAIASKWSQVSPGLGAAALTLPYRQTFEKATYYHILQGDDPTTAAQHAYNDLFGQYTFNGKWMFPANTDATTQRRIEAYGQEVIGKTVLAGYQEGSDALKAEQAALMASNHWQYIPGADSYLLLDANGFIVKDNTGNPVNFRRLAGMVGQP